MKKIIALMFLLSACSLAEVDSKWKIIDEGTSMMTEQIEIEDLTAQIMVYRLKQDFFEKKIIASETPKMIADWGKGREQVILINGGYFHDDFSASGYLSVDGKKIGERMFDQDKSGLLFINDGVMAIRDLSKKPIEEDQSFDYAIQSYPFLIREGLPAIEEDSEKKSRRTAVGIDFAGDFYIFVSDNYLLSLHEFMNYIVQMDLGLEYALNLDGGTSTGMFVDVDDHDLLINSLGPVPYVLEFQRTVR